MKKLLIIGGAGFIGSNACYFFSKKNYKISVIDSLSYASNLQYIKVGQTLRKKIITLVITLTLLI